MYSADFVSPRWQTFPCKALLNIELQEEDADVKRLLGDLNGGRRRMEMGQGLFGSVLTRVHSYSMLQSDIISAQVQGIKQESQCVS